MGAGTPEFDFLPESTQNADRPYTRTAGGEHIHGSISHHDAVRRLQTEVVDRVGHRLRVRLEPRCRFLGHAQGKDRLEFVLAKKEGCVVLQSCRNHRKVSQPRQLLKKGFDSLDDSESGFHLHTEASPQRENLAIESDDISHCEHAVHRRFTHHDQAARELLRALITNQAKLAGQAVHGLVIGVHQRSVEVEEPTPDGLKRNRGDRHR